MIAGNEQHHDFRSWLKLCPILLRAELFHMIVDLLRVTLERSAAEYAARARQLAALIADGGAGGGGGVLGALAPYARWTSSALLRKTSRSGPKIRTTICSLPPTSTSSIRSLR